MSPDAADVAARETLSGRKFDIVHFYRDRNDTFPNAAETSLANGGRILFYNWDFTRVFGNDPANVCWSQIAAGQIDADIDRVAANLRAFGQKLFLAVQTEPDTKIGTCNAPSRIFGSAADYVAAMRRVHDRMVAAGTTNVVWTMAYSGFDLTRVANLYPGDAYVDWIMWDPYNWYGCDNRAKTWEELTAKTGTFYNWAQTNHPNKPLGLSEYGANEPLQFAGDTHSKGQWFRNIAAGFPTQRPAIRAVVYYDRDHRSSTGCWFSVDSSTDSLNGWKAMGADPYFNQPHTTPPITYISAGKAASGDQVTSIQAVNPPGVLPTDLVVLDLFTSGLDTTTVSVPPGWTQVPGSPAKANYGEMWRFVETNPDATTPAPLVTWSAAYKVIAVTYAFRYASGIGPSASAADSISNTTPIAVPTTQRTARQLLVVGNTERVANPPNPTITPGTGFTERTETSTTQTSAGGGTMELATMPVTTTGSGGGELFQTDVAARDLLIVTALNPSP